MFLVEPNPLYRESFLKAYNDILAENNHRFVPPGPHEGAFEEYCQTLIGYEKGLNLPGGYVPYTLLWLIDNNGYIGNVSIRHRLNDHLLKLGGHIGYIISPAHRKKGYGTKILELGLKEAAKLGLKKVLVTCDYVNVASSKIVEKNGGVLENEVYEDERQVWKKKILDKHLMAYNSLEENALAATATKTINNNIIAII